MKRRKKIKKFPELKVVEVGNNNRSATPRREYNGQRPMFSVEVLDQVTELSMLGATNAQLALFFGRSAMTIDGWLRKYPEFIEARKRGGIIADMKASGSLFKRGNGFYYEEEEMKYVNKKWVTFMVKKYCIPDTTALIFWLKNRQRELWTDVHRVQHGGTINHEHQNVEDIDVTKLSEKAQKVLFEIANAQLTDGTRNN